MKLLITGGGGLLGARLARTLLARGVLATPRTHQARAFAHGARGPLSGRSIEHMVLTDIAPPTRRSVRRRVPPRPGRVG